MNPTLHIVLWIVFTANVHAQSGWFWQNPLPQGNDILSIHFVDTNVGTAVGMNGTILHTTNGGVVWTAQTSGVTNSLYSVFFTNVFSA